MKQLLVVVVLMVCVVAHAVSVVAGGATVPPAPQACVVHCRAATASAPPVCGSDGVTYGSTCLLKAMQCRDPTVIKAHDGKCDETNPNATTTTTSPPSLQDDPFHATPEPTTRDPCLRTNCSDSRHEICASNNATFLNKCHFDNARCTDTSLRVAHRGACVVVRAPSRPAFCDESACSEKQKVHAPTCGSDGTTYLTACAFKAAFCRRYANLSVVHDGPCQVDET